MIKFYFLFSLIICLQFSCKTNIPDELPPHLQDGRGVTAKNAMVVSAREEASEIAISILQKGGNAFDAMVATEMALAVVYPYAGNLGGGGFMVYRMADGRTGALDYREKAPMEAYRDMYLNEEGNVIPEKSQLGPLAIGVPGTVAGIFAAHEKFGSLPIREILSPVIELASSGFVVTSRQAQRLNEYQELFLEVNQDSILFAQPIKKGDTLKNIAIAHTLEVLASEGREAFYNGSLSEVLIDFLHKKGSIVKKEDLMAYQAKWRDPISINFKGYQIFSMSPPSSGGIVLSQILKMIEPYPLRKFGHNTLKSIQLITEAEKRAYADRSYFLGDPDYVEIPSEFLTSVEYLHTRIKSFSFDSATPSTKISHGTIPAHESKETTHYSIVDQWGNAVSVTTTLNGAYGSKLYASELGFFLNNQMDDFSAKPGEPNMFGLIGGDANAIEPEKRMLSSMTPTIVEKNGELFMVLGSPGGATIITSVLQTILNVIEYDQGMQQAVSMPRFHHQWLPDEIVFEPHSFDTLLFEELRLRGYQIKERQSRVLGKVDAVLKLENGWLEGGADPRGDDAAVGF